MRLATAVLACAGALVAASAAGAAAVGPRVVRPPGPTPPPVVGVNPAVVPDARVSTGSDLVNALNSGKKYIWIENNANIDLASISPMEPDCPTPGDAAHGPPPYQRCSVLRIPDGVTLASGRSPTQRGGLLYLNGQIPQRHMLDLGSNTRITGLTLRGYDTLATTGTRDQSSGIQIGGTWYELNPDGSLKTDTTPVLVDHVLIDNDELSGWPNAAIGVASNGTTLDTADHVRITNNFIHNQVSCAGGGYGIFVGADFGVGTAYAYIDRNLFDYNRHSVSGSGEPQTGYIAVLNFLLYGQFTCDGNYNQNFDMHGKGSGGYGGTAGEHIEVRKNAIRGNQHYGGHLGFGGDTRPAFQLRGTPTDVAIFSDNVLTHSDEDAALRIDSDKDALKSSGKLVTERNHYSTDTSFQLAVGDFDGDHRADVFQATGTGWWYSPQGRREWRFLNPSSVTINRLGFGDFNGDGKTDVLTQDGGRWLVSYGGTSGWTPLRFHPRSPMSQYAFGDFNGDGRADVFRANGSSWSYSSAGATGWRPLGRSRLKVNQLRFGDFNGDRKTDVLYLSKGRWTVSYGGTTPGRALNGRASGPLRELLLGDFDGDHHTDIARVQGKKLQISLGGRTPWRTPRRGVLRAPVARAGRALAVASATPVPQGWLVGDFTGDGRADALGFAFSFIFPGLHFSLLNGGNAPLSQWSLYEMR